VERKQKKEKERVREKEGITKIGSNEAKSFTGRQGDQMIKTKSAQFHKNVQKGILVSFY